MRRPRIHPAIGMDGNRYFEAVVRLGARLRSLATLSLEVRRHGRRGPISRVEQAHALQDVATRIAAAHGLRTVVSGELPSAPSVLVANHLSYVDPLLLASLTPCTAIARSELESWPLLGAALSRAGVLFVRRGDPESGALVLRHALYALRAGVTVVNFPEGSASRGDSVLRFRRGIFGIAQLAGAPVVPVALSAGHSGLPHYARMASRVDNVLRVAIGAPLVPNRYASADALARAAERRIRELSSGT